MFYHKPWFLIEALWFSQQQISHLQAWDNVSYSDLRTSWLDLPYAHVHHHGPGRVVGVHQGRQVAAVDFTDVPQVGFAVIGHQRGALLVDVQPAVCRRTHGRVTFARSEKSNSL